AGARSRRSGRRRHGRSVKRLAIVAALALAAGALFGTSGAHAAPSKLRVIKVKGPAFPVRTFVIVLPSSSRLTLRNVRATENGTPVYKPSLTPASRASRKTFGVVLA